jgi:anti-sigma B factor antagonist
MTVEPKVSPVPNADWHDHRKREAVMLVETVRWTPVDALVRVVGELDMATAAPLWAVLEGHCAAGRRFLRLDVSGLTFVDATALTGITAAHRALLANRGTLVLTGVHSLVARVLLLTGLDEVLFVGGTRADDDHVLPDPPLDAATGAASRGSVEALVR